uniref:Uncharacterized protein n=1 Tax=Ditylenchus dipsaci TaxID=166011 RepID=A0A915DCM1_9BILA
MLIVTRIARIIQFHRIPRRRSKAVHATARNKNQIEDSSPVSSEVESIIEREAYEETAVRALEIGIAISIRSLFVCQKTSTSNCCVEYFDMQPDWKPRPKCQARQRSQKRTNSRSGAIEVVCYDPKSPGALNFGGSEEKIRDGFASAAWIFASLSSSHTFFYRSQLESYVFVLTSKRIQISCVLL